MSKLIFYSAAVIFCYLLVFGDGVWHVVVSKARAVENETHLDDGYFVNEDEGCGRF
jgi:hypothetical protein